MQSQRAYAEGDLEGLEGDCGAKEGQVKTRGGRGQEGGPEMVLDQGWSLAAEVEERTDGSMEEEEGTCQLRLGRMLAAVSVYGAKGVRDCTVEQEESERHLRLKRGGRVEAKCVDERPDE